MSGYQKEIIDSIYDAFLITSGVVGIGFIAKKAMGVNKPMAKTDFEDIAKLTAYIASSSIAVDYAKKKGWIPSSIVPK